MRSFIRLKPLCCGALLDDLDSSPGAAHRTGSGLAFAVCAGQWSDDLLLQRLCSESANSS